MDNSNKAIAKRLTELEKIVRNLLADAPWKQHEKSVPSQHQTHDEQNEMESVSPILSERDPTTVHTNDPKAKWYNSLEWWKAQAQGMQDGKIYSAVFGWVIYSDQFGPYWYRFCNWSGAVSAPTESTADAGECVAWNRIGDGKPDVPVE